ncbi:MAG: methyl-accepting chemotaxis protein [Gammaproteobacteria bacterium]|nr:methyl-accepting chemotaxis protein [Gammaproteobacteria bacterium]
MARSSDSAFPMSVFKDKTFQLRQIRRVLFLTLFFIVQSTIVLGIFYYFLLGNLVEGQSPLLFASEDLALIDDRIPSISAIMMRWLGVMLLINAAAMLVLGVYIMRKLGNPIMAMHRALRDIGAGNLNVRLRESDSKEFSELCHALNRATETIQEKIEEARQVTRIAEALDQQPGPNSQDMQQALAKCQNVLSYFEESQSNIDRNRSAANGDVNQ